MIETNGKIADVTEARLHLEQDKKDRQQRAVELFNKCLAEIQGKDLRCNFGIAMITIENGIETKKQFQVQITANE